MTADDLQDPYCYQGTSVLINKFNLRNIEKLKQIERVLTGARLIDLHKRNILGKFDFAHLKAIHKYIFQDIYPFAGKIRTCDISKGIPFCHALYIDKSAYKLFKELASENYLKGLEFDNICKRGAYYLCEINSIHPFREGNGRVQREFLRQLFLMNGFNLNYAPISKEEMIAASIAGMIADYAPMTAILRKCTTQAIKKHD